MTESVSSQNLFHIMAVRNKLPIEKIDTCYLRAWVIESGDQTNMRKNKSILIGF